ncbi:hypothetical protein [Micromonospora sp. NPDC005367]|uniref:hypothetical protein n=1 Tax=Micromonospora sp. NPDC005367 TaxID=3155590 RepID=UPI0033BE5F65
MTLLPAVRSRDEADLYLELHPCPRCGSMEATWEETPTAQGTRPAYRYSGHCADCGEQREFVFALPDGQPAPASPGPHPTTRFGGPQPSALLDPGEWLLVADWCGEASEVAERQGDDAEAADLRWTAVAAMEEVRKFVPAEGDVIPESAFWSTRGRTVYQRDPGRFRRRRLEVIRDFYLNNMPWSPS